MQQPNIDPTLYKQMVGKFHFLYQTEPDITFAINLVNCFSNCLQRPHLNVVKQIFQYIQGTVDFGLCYKQEKTNTLTSFFDADWIGDRSDKKSSFGHTFLLGTTLITWRIIKQSYIAYSSIELEYVALSSSTREVAWLPQLL